MTVNENCREIPFLIQHLKLASRDCTWKQAIFASSKFDWHFRVFCAIKRTFFFWKINKIKRNFFCLWKLHFHWIAQLTNDNLLYVYKFLKLHFMFMKGEVRLTRIDSVCFICDFVTLSISFWCGGNFIFTRECDTSELKLMASEKKKFTVSWTLIGKHLNFKFDFKFIYSCVIIR